MVITVNVNINAPGLSNAILTLAGAISSNSIVSIASGLSEPKDSKSEFSFKLPTAQPEQKEPTEKTAESTPATDAADQKPTQETSTPESEPDKAPSTTPAPTVTLEQVRAKLAAISQSGKQSEVKKLLNDFGAKKLTDIPAEKYAELMAAAEGI